MAQLVEARRARATSTRARALHSRLLPLMEANFIESNPIPVKAAMALLGLLEETYRLPMVPPKPSHARARARVLALGRLVRGGARRCVSLEALRASIERLAAAGGRGGEDARAAVRRVARGAVGAARPRAAEPDGAPTGWRVNAWVKQGILLGFRHGALVDVSDGPRPLAVLRQGHPARSSALELGAGVRLVPGGSAIRDGAYLAPGVIVHAADVRQHRRLRGRGHDDRLARARGLVRAGRPARPRQRRGADRRGARAGRARCR